MTETTAQSRKTTKRTASRKEEAVTKAKDSVNNALESVKDAGTEALERAQSAGEAAYSTSTDMVRGAQTELDTIVRRNPTIAVVGALGLGVLLGMALRSRD